MQIIRPDGVRFAIGSTRSSYQSVKKNDLEKIIKSDSQEFGEFVRSSKQPNGGTSVSYSKEGGYSTGEYILSLLPREQSLNAMYAEVLEDESGANHHVCVLIVDGNVVGEFAVNTDDGISDFELNLLNYSDVVFNIISAGNGNLISSEDSNSPAVFFTLAANQIGQSINGIPFLKNAVEEDLSSYKYVSVAELLKAKSEKQAKAIGELRASSPKKTLFQILILVVGITFIAYRFMSSKEEEQAQTNPFDAYRTAVESIYSPITFLNETIRLIDQITYVDGWNLTKATIEGNVYRVNLTNDGGDISGIKVLKDNFGDITVSVLTESAEPELFVEGTIKRTERGFPFVLYSIKEIEYLLFEFSRINGKHVLIKEGEIDSGVYLHKQYTLRMNEITINEIQTLAVFMRDRPIVVNKVDILPMANSFNIDVSVTIFGAP